MGDPSGIGPEVTVKALARPGLHRICRPWVIGDGDALREAARSAGVKLSVRTFAALPEVAVPPRTLPVLQIKAPGDRLMAEILKTAARLALQGKVGAVVTAPIRKSSLALPEKSFPGHTEFFAEQAGVKEVGMMLVGGPLRVLLATTHAGMAELPRLLTREKVLSAIRLTHGALKNLFGIPRPRIAVAALNPHGGEGGLFGQEEIRVIAPAALAARAEGIEAGPPIPADTAFRKAVLGDFDAVVAMYHDQALIPVKLLAFGKAVNLTVGLPFIRTSVDHGTADEIAGKGVADPGSLIAAVRLAVDLIRRRKNSHKI